MEKTYPVRDDDHSDHDHSDEDSYSYEDWHGMSKQMCCPFMLNCPYMHDMMHHKSMKFGREDDETDDDDILRQRPRPHFGYHIRPHIRPHFGHHIRPPFFPYFIPYNYYDYNDDYESDDYDEY